jgi:hypothetical protein
MRTMDAVRYSNRSIFHTPTQKLPSSSKAGEARILHLKKGKVEVSNFERLSLCRFHVDPDSDVANSYFSVEVPSNGMRIAKAAWNSKTA